MSNQQQASIRPADALATGPSLANYGAQTTTALSALTARLPRPDIALDLAEDIGSARWFRGFGAMLGLSLAVLLLLLVLPMVTLEALTLPTERAAAVVVSSAPATRTELVVVSTVRALVPAAFWTVNAVAVFVMV